MNSRHPFRHRSPAWAIWLFAAALLLKAAMPMLASAAAQQQGKTLVEVCTVYGVSKVALDADASHAPADDGGVSHHAQDHCPLGALAAFAAAEPQALVVPGGVHAQGPPSRAHPSSQAPDASATWVARLKHGPPTLS